MTKLIGKDSVRFTLIKPCDIDPDCNQPRKHFDEYELSLLTDSIKQNGIIQPLSVRPNGEGKYILIAGERRLRAAISLGLKKVPCIIHRTDEKTAAYYSIIENLQRTDLTVFEEAEGISRLIKEYGMPYSEVAEKLGIAQSTLSNKLRILRLDNTLRERITAAALSERHARALIRLPEEKRKNALDKIIAEGYTIRECEKYIDSLLNGSEKAEQPVRLKTSIGDLRIFSNSLSRLVDTMVSCGINAKQERIDGKDYIEYRVKIKKAPREDEAKPVQLTLC
ncbi:MAG: ParB/RepB/Spo0J family partition protein [Acutalibacteraceae bacterium]|nr:ParB/RepB/Spo0J family partition protein [Acutalibacteraceae bacterium]